MLCVLCLVFSGYLHTLMRVYSCLAKVHYNEKSIIVLLCACGHSEINPIYLLLVVSEIQGRQKSGMHRMTECAC